MADTNKDTDENALIHSVMHCNSCKFYESYRDAYFGDKLEPDDEGFCRGNDDKDFHTFGEDDACKHYSA